LQAIAIANEDLQADFLGPAILQIMASSDEARGALQVHATMSENVWRECSFGL
jgi:hypothetical protein